MCEHDSIYVNWFHIVAIMRTSGHACIAFKWSSGVHIHRFRLMLDLIDCYFPVALAVCHYDWMADYRRPVSRLMCDLRQFLDHGHRCFFDRPTWFVPSPGHFDHGRCDRYCLNFRFAYELFSLQHSIFGHLENFRDSTGAVQCKNKRKETTHI